MENEAEKSFKAMSCCSSSSGSRRIWKGKDDKNNTVAQHKCFQNIIIGHYLFPNYPLKKQYLSKEYSNKHYIF